MNNAPSRITEHVPFERVTSTDAGLLPARKVWERYGVTDRTLDRWIERENLNFPKPILINRRRYWRQGEIEAFERSQASNRRSA